MRPPFSEFSFGYALTEALVRDFQHTVQPVFPTQREERDVGYDVGLKFLNCPGYPIFLQFKLCHRMERRTAKEYADFGLPLSLPFLRMPIMPRRLSPQHDSLLNWEGRGEEVFYAAPRFFLDKEFTDHYRNRVILDHSAFIRPSAIGVLPDDRDHHIAFDCNAEHGWLLSEPRPLEPILNGGRLLEEMNIRVSDERPLLDRIHAALGNLIDMVIDENVERDGFFSEGWTLQQLSLVIRHVYPDFPEIATIAAFQHALRAVLDESDAPGRSVALLGSLAQLYCNSAVFLISELSSK